MKISLFIIIGIIPVTALADDPLPKRPDFNRYQAMLTRSPFAIATVAVPTATPDFAKDLYIANAAHFAVGEMRCVRDIQVLSEIGSRSRNGYGSNGERRTIQHRLVTTKVRAFRQRIVCQCGHW